MILGESNGFFRGKLLTNWFIQSLTAVIKMHFDPQQHNIKLSCIAHFTIGAIILCEQVNCLCGSAVKTKLAILINHF